MNRPKRRWMALGLVLTFVGSLLALLTIFLVSARVPNRWQEVTAGMNRIEVAGFLADKSAITSRTADGRDEWRIKRLIGDWLLLVSYDNDGSFSHAHLRYSAPIFGEYTRARNYSANDEPYDIRAKK